MFRRGEPFFYAFDLLWLNGQDLRGLRLLGVIYLDSSVPGAFQIRHLNLQIAIASVAALALNHWRYIALLEGENQRLRDYAYIDQGIVGNSPAIRKVRDFISKVAGSESTVLILGESGTGKELVARDIHRNSRRKDGPFAAVNCAAIVDSLIESELFGHERGAFSGAIAPKEGKSRSGGRRHALPR